MQKRALRTEVPNPKFQVGASEAPQGAAIYKSPCGLSQSLFRSRYSLEITDPLVHPRAGVHVPARLELGTWRFFGIWSFRAFTAVLFARNGPSTTAQTAFRSCSKRNRLTAPPPHTN